MNKLKRKIVSLILAGAVGAGCMSVPVFADSWENDFFDSVVRYISFDYDTSDFANRTAVGTDVVIEAGKYGNAGVFNGSSSYINLGNIDSSQGKSFTVAYWIKAGDNQDAVVAGNKDWESGTNKGWTTGIYKNAIKANSGYGNSGKDKEERADTASYTLGNEWVYFAAVYNMNAKGTSTVTAYINGEKFSERRVVAGNLESTMETMIGKDSAADTRFYDGMLDEFMMCDKALSQDEIIYAMNLCKDGGTFAQKYNAVKSEEFVDLQTDSGSVELGNTIYVPVEYQGDSIDVSKIQYQSMDQSVAAVSQSGEITPLKMGNTVITVSYNDANIAYEGQYNLTVTGKSFDMSKRQDKSSNPSSDGWEFLYAPKGTTQYQSMTSYTASGDIWRKGLTGNDQYVRLNGTGFGHHPGADDDVIIKWTAPESGYINIEGCIIATAYSDTNKDGVNLTVSKGENEEELIEKLNVSFDNDFQNGGKSINKNTIIEAGEAVYFRIDNDVNNSADGFNFCPVITYIEEETTISLSSQSTEMKVGETEKVPVNTTGNIDKSLISYSSVNDNVASVDNDGNITANSIGITLIKVNYENGSISYSAAYVVKVVGEQYRMSTRSDKTGNPSADGWGFVYAPVGTNDYINFETHSTSSDEWSTSAEGYTRINASGSNSHPGTKHDVAIVWTAPQDGAVNLGGHFENTNTSSSDGVKLTILKGDESVKSMISFNDGGKDLDETIEVKQGDKIYFRFNCVSSNGNDHFKFDPIITYCNPVIETKADSYMIKPGAQMDILSSDLFEEAISADESIASVVNNDGFKIVGSGEGSTKILLISGEKTKVLNVEVTNTQQPYKFSFGGAEQTNPGAVCRIFTHLNTGDDKTVINDLSFEVKFDNTIAEILDYKGNPITTANNSGVYEINMSPGKVMSSNNSYDADSTKLNAFYLRVKETDVQNMNIQINSAIINGVAVCNELCQIENLDFQINTNPDEDRNGDGLISVGDVAVAAANAEDEDAVENIAQKSGFYPIKRVFVIGIDGAGNSIDPENAWYQYSNSDGTPSGNEVKFSAIGGKPEDKRWDFVEDVMLKEGAYTFDSLPCNPSMSAPNWTAILHGYNYYDAPTDTSGVVQRIDNEDAGNKYFPENDSKWSSFMKVAREQMPNRNLISNSNWTAIDMGIIEQSIGVWSTPYSSIYEYDGRDAHITDSITEQINSGITKNMSVMFVHFDEMDHIGHDTGKGFYSDSYYEEAKRKDEQLQEIYNAIYTNEGIKDDTILIVTTDHGGQSHYHGGTQPSELYSFITINGPTVNSGYTWSGDVEDEEAKKNDSTRSQTRDIPAIVAKALGLDADADWKGSLKRASGAFLTQKEMIKKNRDIETVEYGGGKVSVTNLKNTVTAMDITLKYSGSEAPEISASSGSTVYLKEADTANNTVHMIIYNPSGLGKNCVVSDSDIEVENVMLATDAGKEIYADIKTSDNALIEYANAENDQEISVDTISDFENIKVGVVSKDAKTNTSLIVAAYDAQGVLIGVSLTEASKDAGSQEIVVNNPVFGKDGTAEVKIMWFEDMLNVVPISEAFTI